MKLSFDFRRKDENKEVFDFPVLTQLPKNDGKHSLATFKLNKRALEELNYDPADLKGSKISVGKLEGELIIANTTGIETEHQHNLNLNRTISSSFLLKQLVERFEINSNKLNYFNLHIGIDTESNIFFASLELMQLDENTESVVENKESKENKEETEELIEKKKRGRKTT